MVKFSRLVAPYMYSVSLTKSFFSLVFAWINLIRLVPENEITKRADLTLFNCFAPNRSTNDQNLASPSWRVRYFSLIFSFLPLYKFSSIESSWFDTCFRVLLFRVFISDIFFNLVYPRLSLFKTHKQFIA